MRALSLPGGVTKWRRTPGRRANRRTTHSPQERRQRGWFLVALVLGLGVWLVPTSWRKVWDYVYHHPYFAVTDIDIVVEAPFSSEEILRLSGLTRGMSVWAIDPHQVEAQLLTVSGIQEVQVQREFPQHVSIEVQIRHPVAVIPHSALTYLDERGVAFSLPGQLPELDLPYVTGLAGMELHSGAAHTALRGVLPLLSLSTVWAEPLSEIHWDTKRGYTLFLSQRHITIRLGWETTPEKFAQVGRVLTDLPTDGSAAVIDARFVNQVVVQLFSGEHRSDPLTPARPL